MLVLVTYDVQTTTPAGRKRLRQVARACQNHGVRVQYSVFECELEPALWTRLRARLLDIADPRTDSLRFYLMGSGRHNIEHHGVREPIDPDGPLLL